MTDSQADLATYNLGYTAGLFNLPDHCAETKAPSIIYAQGLADGCATRKEMRK